MSVLKSSINKNSPEFAANAEVMTALVNELWAKVAKIKEGGSQRARDKHESRGKLLPRERIRQLLAQRGESQPVQQNSCGSVFRNPPGDHAARLIEAAGLKGKTLGGAQVSEKHANFIINTGAATAADIETLLNQVQGCVEQTHGVRLEPEVRIVGEHSPARDGV